MWVDVCNLGQRRGRGGMVRAGRVESSEASVGQPATIRLTLDHLDAAGAT